MESAGIWAYATTLPAKTPSSKDELKGTLHTEPRGLTQNISSPSERSEFKTSR
jgi:hypothetical protein